MGSPPPAGSGQSRNIDVEAPVNDQDEFQNNFRTYVASMKAFRSAWEKEVGTKRKDVKESPSATNAGFSIDLAVDDQAFKDRVSFIEGEMRKILAAVKGKNWIGPPGGGS